MFDLKTQKYVDDISFYLRLESEKHMANLILKVHKDKEKSYACS